MTPHWSAGLRPGPFGQAATNAGSETGAPPVVPSRKYAVGRAPHLDPLPAPRGRGEPLYGGTSVALTSIRLLEPIVAWPRMSVPDVSWPFCNKPWRTAAAAD